MRGRLALNLALAALVAALAAVVWLRPGKAPPPAPQPLTALEPEQVQRIEITPPHGEPFVLERRDGAWWVARPVQVRARDYRVDSLLALSTTPRRAALAEGVPADFGLDPPAARVKLDNIEIAFGASNPVDYRRYVALAGKTYLIDDGYYHHLTTTWADWVDLRLLPPEATLERVETPSYTLTRTAQRGYALEPPAPGVSADALARRAEDWRHAQALEAHAGRTPPADATALALTFRTPGTEQTQTLHFALERSAGAVLLHRRDVPLAYELAPGEADRLLTPPPVDLPADATPGDSGSEGASPEPPADAPAGAPGATPAD